MVKLVGSLFILTGGGLVWWLQRQSYQRRRNELFDLVSALRSIGEEIRMARTPMPILLRKVAANCGEDIQKFFLMAAVSAEKGEGLTGAWRKGLLELPLEDREREILLGVEFQGDEEKVCHSISLAAFRLAQSVEELERRRPEEAKRVSALCVSGAALLVILLI